MVTLPHAVGYLTLRLIRDLTDCHPCSLIVLSVFILESESLSLYISCEPICDISTITEQNQFFFQIQFWATHRAAAGAETLARVLIV